MSLRLEATIEERKKATAGVSKRSLYDPEQFRRAAVPRVLSDREWTDFDPIVILFPLPPPSSSDSPPFISKRPQSRVLFFVGTSHVKPRFLCEKVQRVPRSLYAWNKDVKRRNGTTLVVSGTNLDGHRRNGPDN